MGWSENGLNQTPKLMDLRKKIPRKICVLNCSNFYSG
jgi:hypothetical protein